MKIGRLELELRIPTKPPKHPEDVYGNVLIVLGLQCSEAATCHQSRWMDGKDLRGSVGYGIRQSVSNSLVGSDEHAPVDA
jgi:hypothetical protein